MSHSLPHFLDLAELSREAVCDLLTLGDRLQREPEPHALAGKILGLVFMNPSLRTLASFQAGMARLGGSTFVITPGQGTWQLETRLGVRMDGVAAEHVPQRGALPHEVPEGARRGAREDERGRQEDESPREGAPRFEAGA